MVVFVAETLLLNQSLENVAWIRGVF